MFKEVNSNPDFPKLENNLLEKWDKNNTVKEYRDKNIDSGKTFSFIDGPITANNPMGVHHAWGRTYKDLFQRFYTMLGHEQRYQNGFDCQGLWVEVEVEKALGFKSKKDIQDFGVEKFVNLCKERVNKYSAVQRDQSIRLGYWMDWEDSYFTMSDENNYSIWGFLKQMNESGKIYKGTDVVPWSGRSGTSYSQMEIIEGRKLVAHKSVFIKFKLKNKNNEYALVWTTTPWTLTSNVSLLVNKNLNYAKCKLKNDEIYYVAEKNIKYQRLEKEFKEKREWVEGVPKLKTIAQLFNERGGYTVEKIIKGSDMIGWEYEGPYDEFKATKIDGGFPFTNEKLKDEKINAIKCHKIYDGGKDQEGNDVVTSGEGTGIVHTAPGCGDIDYKIGQKNNLVALAPLDEEANFIENFDWLKGKNATDSKTIELILEDLKNKDLLFYTELYPHIYPHCWRSGDELVFRLVDEWYINMDWRNDIKKSVDEINWVPAWGKQREHEWLNNMGDWMISKKRFWGLALPIWQFEDDSFYVIGSKEELKKLAVEGWKEFEGNSPHRPWIDKIKIKHPKTGLIGTRVLDVGNPWLDAGIVGFSTLQYRTNKKYWNKWFPADLISESFPGQFRNWFYSYLTMGAAISNKTPTKNIFSYALVRDESGAEMHKSQGNAIWFDDAAEEIGVDVIRWLYTRQNPEINLRFGPKIANEIRRQVILPIWNIYSFFTNYAILDKFTPPQNLKSPNPTNLMDKWILIEMKETSEMVKEYLKLYQPDKAALCIENFINLLSNWYIRRNRRRFWKSGKFENNTNIDHDKYSAYETLYFVLITLSKIMSPIIPFITDEIYSNLTNKTQWKKNSVHLEDFPAFNKKNKDDEKLQIATRSAMRLSSLGRSARSKTQIKVRQPINNLLFKSKQQIDPKYLEMIKDQVKDEVNVKNVDIVDESYELSETNITLNKSILGPKIGNKMGDLIKELNNLDHDLLIKNLQKIDSININDTELSIKDFNIKKHSLKNTEFIEDNNYEVSIDTKLNPSLIDEGSSRELIHNIQNLRKDSGFNISDKIIMTYSSDEYLKNIINKFESHISQEILATNIIFEKSETGSNAFQINNSNIFISLKISN